MLTSILNKNKQQFRAGHYKISHLQQYLTRGRHHFDTTLMLKIDRNIFFANLSLTQQYCRLQMDKKHNDNAKVFRSYNPALNNQPIFSFELHKFNFDIEPNLNYCTLTTWSIDPTA